MMDEAIKTHKESAFGWVLLVQRALAAARAGLVRRASQQAERAAAGAQARPRRHLTPR